MLASVFCVCYDSHTMTNVVFHGKSEVYFMKRTLCWILIISMVLGLIAGLVVSVSATENTVVDRVDLTLQEPADGVAVGGVTLPEDANYMLYTYTDFVGYEWKEESNWYAVPTQFESGKVYELRLELAAAEGYAFAENVDIYVNGKLIKDVSGSGQLLETTLRYSLKKQIDRVDVTIPEYTLGDVPKPADAVLPENADYILNTLSVYSRLHDTDFTQGLQKDRYRIEIYLQPSAGCEFTEDLKLYINGRETTEGYSSTSYAALYHEISFCEKITSVAFPTLPSLKVGDVQEETGADHPDFVAPEGANYSLVYEWMQADTDYMSLTEFEGTVADKSQYWLMYGAIPNAGYEFAETMTVTVNGVSTEMMLVEPEKVVGVKQYVFGLQIIDKVELITNPYVVGGQMGQITIPENSNYHLEQTAWGVSADGTLNDVITAEGDVFEEGKYYLVGAMLAPNDGYVFAQDAVITVNGVAANLSVREQDEEMLTTNGAVMMAYHSINKEATPPEGDNPPTGNTSVALAFALAVLSAAGLALTGKKQ